MIRDRPYVIFSSNDIHFEEKVVKKREFSSNDIHFEENFLFRGKATVLEENGKALLTASRYSVTGLRALWAMPLKWASNIP